MVYNAEACGYAARRDARAVIAIHPVSALRDSIHKREGESNDESIRNHDQ